MSEQNEEDPARGYKVPEVYTVWKHYKGNVYRIVGFCRDSENGELMILYSPIDWGYVTDLTCIVWGRRITDWYKRTDNFKVRFEQVFE